MTRDEYYNNLELYHHGIQGQKWGVRRYQNKDGTLTAAGEKRLNTYKEKQSAYAVRKYTNTANTYQAKLNKAEKKGNTKKIEKIKSKMSAGKSECEKQLNYIKNMSYKDMKKEKANSRLTTATVLGASACTVGLAAMGVTPVGFLAITSQSANAYSYRNKQIAKAEKENTKG